MLNRLSQGIFFIVAILLADFWMKSLITVTVNPINCSVFLARIVILLDRSGCDIFSIKWISKYET